MAACRSQKPHVGAKKLKWREIERADRSERPWLTGACVVRLRLCIGPNAFGNALGSAIGESLAPTSDLERKAKLNAANEKSAEKFSSDLRADLERARLSTDTFGLSELPEVRNELDDFAYSAKDRADEAALIAGWDAQSKERSKQELAAGSRIAYRNLVKSNNSVLASLARTSTEFTISDAPDWLGPRTPAEAAAFIRANPLSSMYTSPPNMVQKFGGAAELTVKGYWNAGVAAYAGITGLASGLDDLVGNTNSGPYSVERTMSRYHWGPSSEAGKYMEDSLARSSIIRGFADLKTGTGEYYAERFGPVAGGLATAAPEALLFLLPGAPKAFKNFGSTVLENAFSGASAGGLRAQRGSTTVDFLTGGILPDNVPVGGSTIRANSVAGEAWSAEVIANVLPLTETQIQREITVRSLGPSNKRTRLDALGTNIETGAISMAEMKASITAPFTKNQKVVHPELAVYGGVVVGAGKAPYVGGTIIPPTPVIIYRKK